MLVLWFITKFSFFSSVSNRYCELTMIYSSRGTEMLKNVSEFKKLPKMVYDYYTSGTEDKWTLRENWFRPFVSVDVSSIDMVLEQCSRGEIYQSHYCKRSCICRNHKLACTLRLLLKIDHDNHDHEDIPPGISLTWASVCDVETHYIALQRSKVLMLL
ncbi:hypothetical protein QYE76_054367 [Lolium multiflorum]|uniref:Uncharacterized protein n=1 Tax=Lolium multiflorum TaxID=4521 RepID=A0AAD8SXJ5_LOLMU|nr:hypothetical protein QYE76_054367 [Lolium multiflorum]